MQQPAGGDQATVLIVDDDPKIVRLVKASLQPAGFEVLSAGDGEAGLAMVEEERPDLVILDREHAPARRPDRLRAHPRVLRPAGPHADRAQHRERPGGRPRGRRRRLRPQAVQPDRAAGARARAPASGAAGRPERRRLVRRRRPGGRPRATRGAAPRRAGRSDAHRVASDLDAGRLPWPRVPARGAEAARLGRALRRVGRAAARLRPLAAAQDRAGPGRAPLHAHPARRRLRLPAAQVGDGAGAAEATAQRPA